MYFGRGSPEVSVYESLLGDSDRIASDRNSIYVTDDQVRHMARGGDEIVDEGDVGRNLAQDRLRKKIAIWRHLLSLGG